MLNMTYWFAIPIPIAVRIVTAVTTIKLASSIVIFIIAIIVTNPVLNSSTLGLLQTLTGLMLTKRGK